MEEFNVGDRVNVFDPRLYIDDVKTPISMTMKPATVIKWYGKYDKDPIWNYESLIDVVFDHRPDTPSKGHITGFVHKNNGRTQEVLFINKI